MLEDVATKEAASNLSEMLQKALSRPFGLGGKEVVVTASMGIAHSAGNYVRPEDILRDAELAMYRAKEFGKARSIAFDPAMSGTTVPPLDVEDALSRAIARNQTGRAALRDTGWNTG